MKKVIAWLLVLALTAAISIGATLAYLTDTDEDVNVMTLGKVKIDQLEYERIDTKTADKDATVQIFHDNKPLLPAVTDKNFDYTPGTSYVDWEQIGKDDYTSDIWDPAKINNEVDKMVFVKNKGDYDAYVRSVFAFEAGNYKTLDEFQKKVHLNLNTTDYSWEWLETPVAIPNETGGTTTTNYFIATATYNKVLAPGALTEISLSQIALDKTATNEDVKAFGDTYQVLVKSQGIQADGFEDPDFALNEGFGPINGSNVPWTTDQPPKGVDLKTALHYLDANTSGTKITKKVTKVVFGLNKDYPDITSAYTGTLVTDQQDVPVYAYYVPDGTNYHIYFLADSAIYAPKDCTDLFLEMSALKAVDTTNFDMSRAQILYKMFRLCGALTDIDVSNWNTSNVTSMRAMFSGASSLVSLDTTKWDTSKVVEMNNMFYDCFALTEIKGHENWDTSSATSMVQMFNNCHSLTTLQLGNWDVSHVTRFKAMFGSRNQNKGDMAFTDLDIENWDMSSATDLEAMFYGCGQLTSLDLSKWNVENVTMMSHLFADCYKLQNVDFTGWNTASLTSMNAMFNHCTSLKTLDMSMFDTSNVEAFPQLFEACSSLESIVGLENWNTTSGHDFNEMFSGCGALKELNLSAFDTRNSDANHLTEGKYVNGVFASFASGCGSLEKITFGPNFSFDGIGNCPNDYKFQMPSATNVEGWDGKWYTADGTGYLPTEIPEETAATYYAVKPVTP